MNKLLFRTFIFFLSITSFIIPQKKAFTIEDIYKVKNPGAPVVSPDGEKIVFPVSDSKLEEGKSNTDIYIANHDGPGLKNISNYDGYDGSPIWSADGSIIYFLSARSGKIQLHSYDIHSGEIKQITNIPINITSPLLSPDQTMIAFAADIFPECGIDFECSNKLLESTENGPIQAYIADKLLFRHWTEYNRQTETHIFIYSMITQKYQDLGMSEWASDQFKLGGDVKFAFSPDSKEISYMHNPDENWAASTNADIWTINILTGEKKNITAANKAWDGNPVYSPDGKYIGYKLQIIPAYEADRYMIALYDRTSGQSTILTQKFDQTVEDILWSDDSKTIYFNAQHEGYTPIYSLNIASNKIVDLTGKQSTFGFDVNSKTGTIYYNTRKIDKPAEIFQLNISNKSFNQVTYFNKELLEQVDFRPAEQLWIEGADGKKVQVFLIKPHDFDPSKKYPLILNVHGGPQSQWMDAYRPDWQIYPGSGYVLCLPESPWFNWFW